MLSMRQKLNAIFFVNYVLTILNVSSPSDVPSGVVSSDPSSIPITEFAQQNEIFYVIEPFDSISDQWFTRRYNNKGNLNLTISALPKLERENSSKGNNLDSPLFGNGALRVEYQVEQTESWGGFVDFGWILNSTGVAHNCNGATHISLWYKVLKPQSLSSRAHLRLIMMDDSNCTLNGYYCAETSIKSLEHYYSFHYILDDDYNQWQELRITLAGNDNAISPFWRTGWSGKVGNNYLDSERLRGWRIELSIDSQAGIGGTSDGIILLDQLACIGGRDLLGAAFHPKEIGLDGDLFQRSLITGMWFERYQSEQSRNLSHALLTSDGDLILNYTIEQVDSEGGFLDYQHLAPGNAYYNLSQSKFISFSYNVSNSTSPLSRANLRLILMDGSHCTSNCDVYPGQNLENYYSSNYMLDDNSSYPWSGRITVELEGDSEVSSPFWLSVLDGVLGNKILDVSYIKGYRFELNVDSQGGIGSKVSGIVGLKNLSALSNSNMSLSGPKNDGYNDGLIFVHEVGLEFNIYDDFTDFRRIEFYGSKCSEYCQTDRDCMYAFVNGRDCFTTSHLHPKSIKLLDNKQKQFEHAAYWMDDISKRGDFCIICTCNEVDRIINCRGQDLAILPKSFSQQWTPRILDLRDNKRLSIIGSGSLSSISHNLEELRLPKSMRYISNQTIEDLSALKNISFEANSDEENPDNNLLINIISNSSEFFGDKCCGRGRHFNMIFPPDGLTFCHMEVDTPGIDSMKEPFWEYYSPDIIFSLKPSSSFMAEAAQSPEMCAEYCAITERCNYFSYDARYKESEHRCYLLSNNGTSQDYVCCDKDDFADDKQKTPGWTSGRPPRTRYDIDDAKILINRQALKLDSLNKYKSQFLISLGSMPLRGAVWVEFEVMSKTKFLEVIISPLHVVLYDNMTVTPITVAVLNADLLSSHETIVLSYNVESCDTAFTISSSFVYIDVKKEKSLDTNLFIIIIPISAALFLIVVYLHFSWKRQMSDAFFSVKSPELKFDDPTEIIGSGTFGLVLLAEYRGTQVAVKLVLPTCVDKRKFSRIRRLFGNGDGLSSKLLFESQERNLGESEGKFGSTLHGLSMSMRRNTLDKSSTMGKYTLRSQHTRLKKDFIREMRNLSKLRHPCITTVMGAVIQGEDPMLIMEYMIHGSLHDLLHNETMLIEGEHVLPILCDICHGLRFLHAAKPQVVHGDLKAKNILVDSRFRAKVADFGLSQKKKIGGTGTPYWMAPELLRNESLNTTASDVYSFGIVLYEVYSRREPYEGEEDTINVLRNIADPIINLRPPHPPGCPEMIKSFMSQCLSNDPNIRPSFEQIDLRLKDVDASKVEPGKFHASRQVKKDKDSLTKSLLFEVFPQHIAIALRDGKKVEPETRQIVTIFFSDIVGFTNISSSLSAMKITHMLDRLYSKFDALSIEQEVFKVETIGDAYMAATNLVKDQIDHTARIANFAIATLKAANTTLIDIDNPEMGYVNIRVGFHSGPVVANVVGSRNPRYCLFGDTVNTASRMESNSEKNRIHCSERAAKLLKEQNPEMSISCRGDIAVKGKGVMVTYWVNEDPLMSSEPTEDGSM